MAQRESSFLSQQNPAIPLPPETSEAAINRLWSQCGREFEEMEAEKTNWKQQTLPLARIKKIMKSEEVIYAAERELKQEPDSSAEDMSTQVQPPRFMIAGEAPILLGKACEMLVKELSIRAWKHTERNRRRTLQKQDIHAAVGESEVYDFLIDFVPRVHIPAKQSPAPPVVNEPPMSQQGVQPQQTMSSSLAHEIPTINHMPKMQHPASTLQHPASTAPPPPAPSQQMEQVQQMISSPQIQNGPYSSIMQTQIPAEHSIQHSQQIHAQQLQCQQQTQQAQAQAQTQRQHLQYMKGSNVGGQ